MDILQTLVINDVTYPVHNESDYFLESTLYSDYGFWILYKPRRGNAEFIWRNTLGRNGFESPTRPILKAFKSWWEAETRVTQLNLADLAYCDYHLEWVYGGRFYSMNFELGQSIVVSDTTDLLVT